LSSPPRREWRRRPSRGGGGRRSWNARGGIALWCRLPACIGRQAGWKPAPQLSILQSTDSLNGRRQTQTVGDGCVMNPRIDLKELAARESEQVEWKQNVASIEDVLKRLPPSQTISKIWGADMSFAAAAEGKTSMVFQKVSYPGLKADRFKELGRQSNGRSAIEDRSRGSCRSLRNCRASRQIAEFWSLSFLPRKMPIAIGLPERIALLIGCGSAAKRSRHAMGCCENCLSESKRSIPGTGV